jgi:hypothetical protein
MAAYLADRIIKGVATYTLVFSCPVYKPYKTDVDAILIAEGHGDLIVPIQ